MIEVGILKNFDSGTYKAGVQLAGSLTTYFDDISVAKNIPSSALVIGNYVIVAIPGGNPKDACVIATWPGGTPGGGAFLDLSDTPSSYSGQAGKYPRVNAAETALENGLLLGSHAPRHDIGGADPITWRDVEKLFRLLTDRRVLHMDLKTYDMWEKYVSGSGINYQALMIASAHTGTTAGSCARQNINSQETVIRLPAHHAYYIYPTLMTGNSLGFVGCVKGTKLTETQVTRTLTTAHGGIWYEDGTWYASVSDGTTQTIESVSLEAGAGWLIIIYEADAVKFYWRGALVKTLVVTLPTTGMYGYFQVYVYNKALAANKVIYFYGLNYFT